MNMHLYERIWQSKTREIKIKLSSGNLSQPIHFSKVDFESVGNRVLSRYHFTLHFDDFKVSNNISNSAVARDLARVIQSDLEFKKLLIDKSFTFKFDKDFVLHIS